MKYTTYDCEKVERLTGLQPSETSLSFFSDDNIKLLNRKIKLCILKITKEKYGEELLIEDQNRIYMLGIMRYVYLEYSKYIYIVKLKSIKDKVKELDNLFLNLTIPEVLKSLVSHIKYIRDYNNKGKEFLNRPEITNNNNSGQTKEIFFF